VKIPYVSQSRIALYRDCPFSYYLKYSYEGEKFPESKSIPLSNGSAMHNAIEDSIRNYNAVGEWDANIVIKNYIKYATKYGLPQDVVKEMSKSIRDWAKKYHPPPKIVGIEERQEISIDGVRIVAIMDMVEVDDENNLIIHDWKSNVQPYSGEKMEEDLQAPLYLYIAKKIWPDHAGYKFYFHFIRNNVRMEYVYEDSDLEFNWVYIKNAYEAIVEDDEPEARPSFICAYCPGLKYDVCPMANALREHGVEYCLEQLQESIRKDETFVDESNLAKLIAEKKALQGIEKLSKDMAKVVNSKLMNYLDAKDISSEVICGYKVTSTCRTSTLYNPVDVWVALERDQQKLKKALDVRKGIVDKYIKDGSIGKMAGKKIQENASKKSSAPFIVIRKSTKKSGESDDEEGW